MMTDGCLGMITASGTSLGVARATSTIMQSTTIAEHVDGQSSVTTFKGAISHRKVVKRSNISKESQCVIEFRSSFCADGKKHVTCPL